MMLKMDGGFEANQMVIQRQRQLQYRQNQRKSMNRVRKRLFNYPNREISRMDRDAGLKKVKFTRPRQENQGLQTANDLLPPKKKGFS